MALTFDDGPGPYTVPILRVLRRQHAVATLFVIGRLARACPHLGAAEVNAGCEIGDHTETHAQLALLTPRAQLAQIAEAAQAIYAAGAPSPDLFRPPYGSFDNATLQILRAARMLMVLWSANTNDYTRPGARGLSEEVCGERRDKPVRRKE
jgi:peptidoglycan-N-acetylglucosamine deacetylase